MPVINTNVNSIVAQNATNKSDRAMTKPWKNYPLVIESTSQ